MTQGRLAGPLLIFLSTAAITSVFLIQFCNLVYDCGCEAIWAAGDAHCNIHNPTGKHCPWCVYGNAGYATVYGSMLLTQGVLSVFPRHWPWPARFAASLAGSPVSGGLLALVLGWSTGYWE
ncbi:MAG: hypothetical protein JJE04_03375 [Acidobacteriia bacterium]|nr:hypothetical protein [Terriglobia bacterium]